MYMHDESTVDGALNKKPMISDPLDSNPSIPESQLTFRPLYDSAIVNIHNYCCRACRSGPAAEEYSCIDNIVLMRHGAFCKHFGRKSVTADVNQAVFFSRGSTYRVSHPTDCGDRGTIFIPSPHILNDIIREIDPSIDDRPGRLFPFVTGPCDTVVFWQYHALVQRLEGTDPDLLEPLWADMMALQIIATVLEAAFAQHGLPRKRGRNGTDSDYADRVEGVKTYLTSRLYERFTLDDVACAVHTSPFHLIRVFRRRTGVTIHRYLTRLRLRASLERLSDGANDLTALALDLGFSSHSHFTDAFHREFNRTPSEVRRDISTRKLREIGRSLEV
jgi:AraC family transcriptional regulator